MKRCAPWTRTRELLRGLMAKFNGRMVGEIGDGTLTAFHSAIDAVNCAREVQASLQDQPELQVRIGIHLGDVVFANNTVLGDGVNVASRIHALAPPGGICVSANVHDEIRNKPGTRFKDLGEQRFKNVSRPIRVYQIVASDLIAPAAQASGGRRPTAIIAGAGAVILAALVFLLMQSKSPVPASPPTQTASVAKHTISSLAVLPLDNYSGDPNQNYFADGLTDELTTDLATISQLRVISRGSVMQFKGAHRPPTPEIAKLLNVDAVVEGSVMRSGDKVRVTAQLIDARADKHLWAKSYERNSRDVLAMQDDIALAIAHEINVELTPGEQARLSGAPVVNPEAHDAYLKGRYFISRPSDENVKKSIAQFEEAVRLDPDFAPSYSGLSDAYVWAGLNEGFLTSTEAMVKARETAVKAVQLDDKSADAHTSLAVFKAFYEFDWTGCEREFHRALALNPNYAFAHDQFGLALALQGRLDEAVAEGERAAELDPLSPQILTDATFAPAWQGHYQAAMELANKAAELDPGFFFSQFARGWVNIAAGKADAAIPDLQTADSTESPSWVAGWLAYAYAASGDRAKATAIIEELNRKSLHGYVPPSNLALAYLGMGDRVRAMDYLERAYSAHAQWLCWIKMDRVFDPLRKEPRFIALLKKVGLDK
ncbi:MAG TPA: adenylate/guanylate cyclase domain-containing protein [Candidatus Binataceae bacterium]|nr:adenylate/guanylate cyclase domain-containing protein [Candidatus Binataceae bacterium]